VTNFDALRLVKSAESSDKKLLYLDPPYVEKGPRLYLNAYGESDHAKLAGAVAKANCKWVVSYDDNAFVRGLYGSYLLHELRLQHTARAHDRVGNEVVFFSPGLQPPNMEGVRSRNRMPWAA
jgi:DNA adenine methylase